MQPVEVVKEIMPEQSPTIASADEPAFPVSEWDDPAAEAIGLRSLHGMSKRELAALLIVASMMRSPPPALTREARALRVKEAILTADELFRQLDGGVPA